MLDRGDEVQWQRARCVNHRGMLNAVQVKAVFRDLVGKAIEALHYER